MEESEDEKIVLSQHEEDSDSELPLFQQKKYLAKQKEMQSQLESQARQQLREEPKPVVKETKAILRQEQ